MNYLLRVVLFWPHPEPPVPSREARIPPHSPNPFPTSLTHLPMAVGRPLSSLPKDVKPRFPSGPESGPLPHGAPKPGPVFFLPLTPCPSKPSSKGRSLSPANHRPQHQQHLHLHLMSWHRRASWLASSRSSAAAPWLLTKMEGTVRHRESIERREKGSY